MNPAEAYPPGNGKPSITNVNPELQSDIERFSLVTREKVKEQSHKAEEVQKVPELVITEESIKGDRELLISPKEYEFLADHSAHPTSFKWIDKIDHTMRTADYRYGKSLRLCQGINAQIDGGNTKDILKITRELAIQPANLVELLGFMDENRDDLLQPFMVVALGTTLASGEGKAMHPCIIKINKSFRLRAVSANSEWTKKINFLFIPREKVKESPIVEESIRRSKARMNQVLSFSS